MLVRIIYVHVLVYRRVVKYVGKHYICTCASEQESSKICCQAFYMHMC